MKLKGIAVSGIEIDKKTGKIKPKKKFHSVSAEIKSRKSKKVRVKRRGA